MMFVWNLAIFRFVVLLLSSSVFLLVGRFLYNRYRQRNLCVARCIFGAVLVTGTILIFPFFLRSVYIVSAEFNISISSWAKADYYFSLQDQIGGHLTAKLKNDWITSILNLQNYEKAELMLLQDMRLENGKVQANTNLVYNLAICCYFLRKWSVAEITFNAVRNERKFLLCDYFLGKLAEKRGNNEQALGYYLNSLQSNPLFFPSLYHAVRVLIKQKKFDEALTLLSHFPSSGLDGRTISRISMLTQAITLRQTNVPEIEFQFFQVLK
ncbi:MAG: hypothetical protein NTW95_13405 [Candidatus Aminicenantes bacterium]|nr:hypothetical protein [Candidatus Aminicenantes bacterium]